MPFTTLQRLALKLITERSTSAVILLRHVTEDQKLDPTTFTETRNQWEVLTPSLHENTRLVRELALGLLEEADSPRKPLHSLAVAQISRLSLDMKRKLHEVASKHKFLDALQEEQSAVHALMNCLVDIRTHAEALAPEF